MDHKSRDSVTVLIGVLAIVCACIALWRCWDKTEPNPTPPPVVEQPAELDEQAE